MIDCPDMNKIYQTLCEDLVTYGKKVNGTLELTNVSFELTDIKNNVATIRDISKSYLFGELTWYMNGRNDVAFISKFASLWGKITDDGVTNNSAYGDIIFKRHGFNQVEKIIELLCEDPTSRRAVINFNVPNENVIETKDEICTICLDFYIREGKLYCTAIMRSNDIWYGLPYDVVFFTELQKFIANRLGVEYGTYVHQVVSLHVYDDFITKLKSVCMKQVTSKLFIDIEKLNHYKLEIADYIDVVSLNPKKDIIKLFENLGVCKEVKV